MAVSSAGGWWQDTAEEAEEWEEAVGGSRQGPDCGEPRKAFCSSGLVPK